MQTWWPYSCVFSDMLVGGDRASLEMHLEDMMVRDWRSTWRWSSWRLLIRREGRREQRLHSLLDM
jgi:hypothetical protein